jgi:hypothetical protein
MTACIVLGCSSKDGGSTPQANPCATKGASYLLTFTEMSGGTCGPVPNQVLNINSDSDGTNNNGVNPCASSELTGCTTRDSDCTSNVNGISCTFNTESTFSSDGATLSGMETLSCTYGSPSQSCTSTYSITGMRQ